MSNDDKRRRWDSSTAQLSVAELIARREAETQPIPRITDEETVRFRPTDLSGRELHITELLRREGRAGEEERGGGFSVPKLVALASGGVVLAGTVAFTASNLLSSPDERPLAEVRYDARQAARSTNTVGMDLAAAKPQQAAPKVAETTDATTASTAAPNTQQPRPRVTQQPRPAPTTTTEQAPPPVEEPPAAPPTTSTPPPSSETPPPTSSTPVAPPSTDVAPPPSSGTTAPPTTTSPGLDVGVDLGEILEPIGGFDFFAPAR
ncbi:hypothetical protein [Saccharothrix obliqua]|uniref:hypothetical protein n=1 Tax=Saccharothrix obliqua TaxID=2861747 RepID=UPI001C5EE49E|nr:hypothetical protein [Saccharothrix obliqua]MBW4716054.1 hypothetical protein [Saccharothrix obliqua]